MRGSIKRDQTPHNSLALTLPANVYAGKREKAKILNVEKVRGRAKPCPGSKDKYPVFGILQPGGVEEYEVGAAALSAARYASGRRMVPATEATGCGDKLRSVNLSAWMLCPSQQHLPGTARVSIHTTDHMMSKTSL
jgi:hypothetical protein